MRIIVTGGKGQLGHSLQDAFASHKEGPDLLFIDKEELDITDRDAVEKFFDTTECDILINCAAYTAVDKAESDVENAELINIAAVENLSLVSKKFGFRIIHISTDYVFDGLADKPYKEADQTGPHTVYGDTKLKGEKVLQRINPEVIIIRTAWLYSHYGKNFFLTMKDRALRGEKAKVVADQKGTPTYAGDLAKAILQIIKSGDWIPGIYHFTNEGECTWYDFAREIYNRLGANENMVEPIPTSAFPCPARRPEYSVLSKEKIKNTYKLKIPLWQDSLRDMIKNS